RGGAPAVAAGPRPAGSGRPGRGQPRQRAGGPRTAAGTRPSAAGGRLPGLRSPLKRSDPAPGETPADRWRRPHTMGYPREGRTSPRGGAGTMAVVKNETATREQIASLPTGLVPRHIALVMDGNGRWA